MKRRGHAEIIGEGLWSAHERVSRVSAGALEFLAGLEKNNKKAWFEKHRESYETELLEPAKAFVLAIGAELAELTPAIRAEPRVYGS